MPEGRRHEVVAAMLVRDGTVLLCHRRHDRTWYPNVWDLPGGHIEADEFPEVALTREMSEELDITLPPSIGPHSHALVADTFEMLIWTVREWSGTPVNNAPHEHDAIGWFSADAVLSLPMADERYRAWIDAALAPS
jgi:8-oxo-dGTP diphosphatase